MKQKSTSPDFSIRVHDMLIIVISAGILYFGTIICIANYKTRDFSSETDFKNWLNYKRFTSIGNDHTQMDYAGNLHSPVSIVELKFKGDLMIYQTCDVQHYNVYQENDNWVVSFSKCAIGDTFELVVPRSGDCFIRSVDYDTYAQMNAAGGSVINRLDAAVRKNKIEGPLMAIGNISSEEFPVNSARASIQNVQRDLNQLELNASGLIKSYDDTNEGADGKKCLAYRGLLYQLLKKTMLIDNATLLDSLKNILEVYHSGDFMIGNTVWEHIKPVDDNFIQYTDSNNQLKTLYVYNYDKLFTNAHYKKAYCLDSSKRKIILVGNVYSQAKESTDCIQYLDLDKPDYGLNHPVFQHKSPFYLVSTQGFGFSLNQIASNQFILNADNKKSLLKWNGSEFDLKRL